MDTEKKPSGDLSQEEAADDSKQHQLEQPSTPPKVVVEQEEGQQKQLSPKSQESPAFLKPRSPLGFLKHRIGSKKRRESGGHSEAESESGSSTISNIEAEERRKSSGDFSGTQLTSSLDSPNQQPPIPKPRRGFAKVFHDLRYRSRVTKSNSAPATSMENNSVASVEGSVDTVSNSSYVTPMEAHSSGYSTPMMSSESMVTSPETSIMGESLDDIHSGNDVEKTVQNSPGAEPVFNPFAALPADIRRLVCGVYIIGPTLRPLDVSAGDVDLSALPSFMYPLDPPPAAQQVLSSAGETPHAGRGTETRPLDETPQKPGTKERSPILPDAAVTGGGAPSSATRPLSHHRASVPGSTKELQERPSSANEIRFCFTEYRGHLQSPAGPNNNGISGKTSPGRGLIRSLPADPADMDATGSASNSGYPKSEHLYKVLVIGELGTGKTSIIKRYVHQFFSQHYRATIGVDFALKVVHWDQSTVIRLQLWDIAGQERFGNMTRVYYKEAVGAFIVFDVTRNSTFEAVAKWKQDLDSKVQLPDGSPIPCVLLANKCDQPKEGIAASKAKMDEYCAEKGFAGWFETSAKDNINIDDAAKFLVGRILDNDQWSTSVKEEDADRLDLHRNRAAGDSAGNNEKKKGCC